MEVAGCWLVEMGGLVVGTMWACGSRSVVGSGVGGLVVGTMWACGSGWALAGGKYVGEWVGGWAGGRYQVGVWKWVGVGWWEVCG